MAAMVAMGLAFSQRAAFGAEGVTVTEKGDFVAVEINGELFTQYWFKGNQHPGVDEKKAKDGTVTKTVLPTKHVYFWPVKGPGGLLMTRSWPIDPTAPNEDHDHPHHRGMWFSHGEVNGIDFWSETAKAGTIAHEKFVELKSGKDFGIIRSTCQWISPESQVVLTDERLLKVYNRPANERLFDFEVTLHAPAGKDVVMGDTKEGMMAIRVAESMKLGKEGKGKPPGKGHIVQNTGATGEDTWGKRAEWCDYYGPINDKTVGIAIFDHPQNPVHPTYWHVRNYGLFAANPFGIHDFEKKAPGAGNMTIPGGKSVTFKYRFYMHEGDEKQGKVAERYQEYVSQAK